jgi:hypothetical protein
MNCKKVKIKEKNSIMESYIYYALAGLVGGIAAYYYNKRTHNKDIEFLNKKRSEYLAKYNHANSINVKLQREIEELKSSSTTKNPAANKPTAKKQPVAKKKTTRKRTSKK